MKNKKIYKSTRNFDKDYKNIKEILQDETIEESIKEDGYNSFLNTYPLFDSRKLDKFYIKEREMKKEVNKNISDPKYKIDKEELNEEIATYIRGTIAPYIVKGYSIESTLETVKEVAEELKSDRPLMELKRIKGGNDRDET